MEGLFEHGRSTTHFICSVCNKMKKSNSKMMRKHLAEALDPTHQNHVCKNCNEIFFYSLREYFTASKLQVLEVTIKGTLHYSYKFKETDFLTYMKSNAPQKLTKIKQIVDWLPRNVIADGFSTDSQLFLEVTQPMSKRGRRDSLSLSPSSRNRSLVCHQRQDPLLQDDPHLSGLSSFPSSSSIHSTDSFWRPHRESSPVFHHDDDHHNQSYNFLNVQKQPSFFFGNVPVLPPPQNTGSSIPSPLPFLPGVEDSPNFLFVPRNSSPHSSESDAFDSSSDYCLGSSCSSLCIPRSPNPGLPSLEDPFTNQLQIGPATPNQQEWFNVAQDRPHNTTGDTLYATEEHTQTLLLDKIPMMNQADEFLSFLFSVEDTN